jgi:Mg2+ and Co2+ transporter CorA
MMSINWYVLSSGKLTRQPALAGWPAGGTSQPGENWFDIWDVEPEALRQFLAPLNLHPLLLDHCLNPRNAPGATSYDQALLVDFPALSEQEGGPAYVTVVLMPFVLVTIRHTAMPDLDALVGTLLADKAPTLHHLPQVVYLILDRLADRNVQAQIGVRDQIVHLARTLADSPDTVKAADLATVRWQVDGLVSSIENQLYCVAALNASDNEALKEPHRKAYIQDLLSEAEIAQRAVYRLEARVTDLYGYYQMLGSDRVEKRLRILTILSATTLPLGLITGLLGMNVGGVPGTQFPHGFAVVIALMMTISAVELWYFRRRGWFD